MVTIKQIEAFYWASTLGSFEAAARKLNTAQSTISKRIQEFEQQSKVTLFDRTKRSVRLTLKGEELLRHAEELLSGRNDLIAAMRSPEAYTGRFCFGVTELIALTWLPRLVAMTKQRFPNLTLVFEVDTTLTLHERLHSHQMDLVLATPSSGAYDLERVQLARLDLAWMASPQLKLERNLTIGEIAAQPLIMQVGSSGLRIMVEQWLRDNGGRPRDLIACNSMSALAELTIAGLGIACLPRIYFDPLIKSGDLQVIEMDQPMPQLEYVATYRRGSTGLAGEIASMAAKVCSFEHPRARTPVLSDTQAG